MPGPRMPVESWLSKEEMIDLLKATKAFDRLTTEIEITLPEQREAEEQVRSFLHRLLQRLQSA